MTERKSLDAIAAELYTIAQTLPTEQREQVSALAGQLRARIGELLAVQRKLNSRLNLVSELIDD